MQSSPSACLACPEATWQNESLSVSCIGCPIGRASITTGNTDQASCIGCEDLLEQANVTRSICPLAAVVPVSLDLLLKDSAVYFDSNSSLLTSRASYEPLRGGDSLRLTVDPNDPTLQSANAGNISLFPTTDIHDFDPTAPPVLSSVVFGLMIGLLVAAAMPLIFYQYLPRVLSKGDMMSLAHPLTPGGVAVKRPSMWGVAWTLAFVFVAAFVIINLAVQTNVLVTNTLQPASSNANAGTAVSAFQITLKTYGAPPNGSESVFALDKWCHTESARLVTGIQGFTGSFLTQAYPLGSSCAILFDCLNCGITGAASFHVTMPYVNQLIEWEIWSTGAVPSSWARFYGVVSQLPGRMIDAVSTLRFSAIQAYYLDSRDTHSIAYCADESSRATFSREVRRPNSTERMSDTCLS